MEPFQTRYGQLYGLASGGESHSLANHPANDIFEGSRYLNSEDDHSLFSNQLAEEAMGNGILNGARCGDVNVPDYRSDSQRVDRKIDQYYDVSNDLSSDSYKNAKKNIRALSSGEDPEKIKARRIAIKEEIDACTSHYFVAAVQALALSKMKREEQFDAYMDEIESIFQSRIRDLQVFRGCVQTLQEGEDHEMRLEITRRNQCLKEEAQKFNQILTKAKFFSAEDQREFDKTLAQRKQGHIEAMDNRVQDLNKKKVKLQGRLEKQRIDNTHEYLMYAEGNHHSLGMREISSRERIAMAERSSQERMASLDRVVPILRQIGSQAISQLNYGQFLGALQQTEGHSHSPYSIFSPPVELEPLAITNQSLPNFQPTVGHGRIQNHSNSAKSQRSDATAKGNLSRTVQPQQADNSMEKAWASLREQGRERDEKMRQNFSPEQLQANEETCRKIAKGASYLLTDGSALLASVVPGGKIPSFLIGLCSHALDAPAKIEDFLMNPDPALGELMLQEAEQGRNIFRGID